MFGIVKSHRGHLIINKSVERQPRSLLNKLLPSLKALKNARKFGRHYNELDIKFANENFPDKFVTLDYKAWELTKYQHPLDLFIDAKDIDRTASFLKNNRFSEGKGRHTYTSFRNK